MLINRCGQALRAPTVVTFTQVPWLHVMAMAQQLYVDYPELRWTWSVPAHLKALRHT